VSRILNHHHGSSPSVIPVDRLKDLMLVALFAFGFSNQAMGAMDVLGRKIF